MCSLGRGHEFVEPLFDAAEEGQVSDLASWTPPLRPAVRKTDLLQPGIVGNVASLQVLRAVLDAVKRE
jgi:hypothetical protein